MRAFKKAIQRFSRWAIAIALLPLLWTLCRQLYLMAPALGREGYQAWWLYAAGAAGYLAVEKLVARPMWLYVFGHEVTHAVTGLMSGAKIHSFKACSKGGEVHLSKSNAFIALSPYVIPLYSIILVLIYAATKKWWNLPQITPVFQVLLGISVAFHLSLTLSALHSKQSDLKVMGFFLSGVLIAVGNVLILSLLAVSLFQKTPSLRHFGLETARETSLIWMQGLKIVAGEVIRMNDPRGARIMASKEHPEWTR